MKVENFSYRYCTRSPEEANNFFVVADQKRQMSPRSQDLSSHKTLNALIIPNTLNFNEL